jgi:hypothetical protein
MFNSNMHIESLEDRIEEIERDMEKMEANEKILKK